MMGGSEPDTCSSHSQTALGKGAEGAAPKNEDSRCHEHTQQALTCTHHVGRCL